MHFPPLLYNRLSKPHAIKGNRNRLGKEEDNADGAAKLDPKSPGNQIIIPASFNFYICGNG